MNHLAGFTEEQLAAWAIDQGASGGSARAVAASLVARFAGREPGPAKAELLRRARAAFDDSLPPAEAHQDPDGTVRLAVKLGDGAVIETVLIRQRGRDTVCVSSQVGCARGCVFCETGRLGLQRNLTAAEIVAQFALVARRLAAPPTNVVFMGMGEPLDNLDEVLHAIAVLSERKGFAVPARRVSSPRSASSPRWTSSTRVPRSAWPSASTRSSRKRAASSCRWRANTRSSRCARPSPARPAPCSCNGR